MKIQKSNQDITMFDEIYFTYIAFNQIK